ncbi:CvpA family protein [Flaviaesturariibacter terrae]
MNLIDLLLMLIFAAAAWAGFQRGFLAGVLELGAWCASLAGAWLGYPGLAGLIKSWQPGWSMWLEPACFVGILLAVRGLSSLVIHRILERWRHVDRQPVNRALGLLPGLVNGAIYATLIAGLLLTVPVSEQLSAATQESRIAGALSGEAEWANRRLAPIFDEAIRNSMTHVGTEVNPNETVKLHFTVRSPKTRNDLEARMLELVNEERAQAGLPALAADPELAMVARAHARDMFARGYFSHYTPEHKDPFDRMEAAHISFRTAGENLALGQTLLICHRGLMNSPGHRANILHKEFGRLGIAVLDGGIYGLMIAQEFRD